MSFGVRAAMVVAAGALAGCSLILDPENCTDDGECGGGVCTSGICVGPRTEADLGGMGGMGGAGDGGGGTPAVDAGMGGAPAVDMSGMGGTPADAAPDAALPPDMGPAPQAPSCEILAPGINDRLTTAESTPVSLAVADRDTPLDQLTVTLNGEAITVGADGRYSTDLALPPDGSTAINLRVVDDADLTCAVSATVVSDRVAPTLHRISPAPGNCVLYGLPALRMTGDVEDTHFVPQLGVQVNGADFNGQVVWTGRSFGFDVALRAGENRIQVAAIDGLGNTSPPVEVCVTLDNEPPTVTVTAPEDGSETAAMSTTVTGRVEDDGEPEGRSHITVTVTGPAGGPAAYNGRADNVGAFAVDVELQVGDNTVRVCGDDEAGNMGCTTFHVTRVDDQPCIELTSPEDGAFVGTDVARVCGTYCPAVTEVVLRVGEAEETAQIADGEFCTFVRLPAPGRHTVTGVARTADGDEATDAIAVSYDPTAPVLRITSPNANVCLSAEMVEVCGSARDAESGIASLTVNGQAGMVRPNDTFCQTVAVAPGADVELTARGTNGAGGTADATRSIRVDVRAPVIDVGPDPDAWLGINPSGRVQIPCTVSDDICGLSRLTVDGQVVGTGVDGTFAYQRAYADGEHSIRIVATDAGGNAETVNYSFRVDQTPADIDNLEPGEQVTISEAQTEVCVTASDAGSGVVGITIGGMAVPLAPAGEAMRGCRTIDLPEGLTEVDVLVTDLVGNRRTGRSSIFRDVTGPVVTLTFPPEGAAVPVPTIVEGTVDDGELGAGVNTVQVNGVLAEIDPIELTWRAVGVPVDPEDPVLHVRATDLNQNVSDPAAERAVVVQRFAGFEPGFDGLRSEGDFEAASQVGWIGVADLNADGKPDLIALTRDGVAGNSSVFLQRQDGTWRGRSEADSGLPANATIRDAALGDLNRDGRPDLVIVGSQTNGVWLGNGVGGFERLAVTGISPNQNAVAVSLGDIDRDGTLDALILAGAGSRMYLGNGDGSFEPEALATFAVGAASAAIDAALIDVNLDDTPDLISVGPGGSNLWYGRDGPFVPADPVDAFPPVAARVLAVLDADRDGDLDLLTADADGRFYLNTGGGAFSLGGDGGLAWAAGDVAARVADLDGDARDDLVVYGSDGLKVWYNGADGFERGDEVALGLGALGAVTALSLVDVDADGDHDIVVGTADGITVLRSALTLLDIETYRFARLDVRRARQLDPGPRDAVGAVLYQSLVADEAPERLLIAYEPMLPIIVSLGEAMSSDVVVHYTDIGMPGTNTRAIQIVMELWSSLIEVRARE